MKREEERTAIRNSPKRKVMKERLLKLVILLKRIEKSKSREGKRHKKNPGASGEERGKKKTEGGEKIEIYLLEWEGGNTKLAESFDSFIILEGGDKNLTKAGRHLRLTRNLAERIALKKAL